MSSELTRPEQGWTIATYAAHNEALRQAEATFQRERDRRYREIQTQRDKALKLQGREYRRRLSDLNHEAKRIDTANANNVSSDTWEAFVKTYKDDTTRDNSRFSSIEKFQNKLVGALALASILTPVLTGIVVYILTRHGVPVTK